ncbi:hypothetical protein FB561_2150 [Kribbella amoyensis]|uniref:NAD(P)-binding domain-containing protein n=1 Tax=Kribbella amoyensis TaxID=996641 RepID=A0A561BQC4_9ACTN|nr:NAD(P)H-binding protein [Kribbella amoyensis]TWD81047.1 hypothetical protein FB561_2150 [Kribbella amoyensis]
MSTAENAKRIVVFGAGGRAGRAVVEEARRRGHDVVPVVRDPSKYADLPGAVSGDVTDVADVERLSQGSDAVVAAVYDHGTDSADLFRKSAQALVDGARSRLLWVGLASILPAASGGRLMDEPGYPQEYRSFYLAHAGAIEIFEASALDWISVAPAGDFDHRHPARTGSYTLSPGNAAARISYADLAVALVDELERPRHRRALLGFAAEE